MGYGFIYLLLAAIPVDEVPSGEVLRLFDQHYYDADYEHGKHKSYIYHLFRPRKRSDSEKYPLIVWLHGHGNLEFEEIGSGHLKHTGAIFSSAAQANEFAFYFLAVQCPPDQRGFFYTSGATQGAPEPGEVTAKLIRDLISTEPIDVGRVTAIGISSAGCDCLELGMRYPDMFGGMVLLGAPGCKLTRLANLLEIPIWAFHATEDDQFPSKGIEKTIRDLKEAGGSASLTMIEANFHNCWAVAFRDYALLKWLLSQKRGSAFSLSPGTVAWSWQQWVLQIVLPFLVVLSITNELRRQRKRHGPKIEAPSSTSQFNRQQQVAVDR